jgi:hypothetical protein
MIVGVDDVSGGGAILLVAGVYTGHRKTVKIILAHLKKQGNQ